MTKPIEQGTGLIVITSRGAWEKLADRRQWLFKNAAVAKRAIVGKEAVVYLTAQGGESALGGLIRFAGPGAKVSGHVTGLLYGMYPYRIPIEVVALLEKPLPFAAVKNQLGFIPKGKNWGSGLQGQPIKAVPKEDFETMRRCVLDFGEGRPTLSGTGGIQ